MKEVILMKGKKAQVGHSPRKYSNWAQTPEVSDSCAQSEKQKAELATNTRVISVRLTFTLKPYSHHFHLQFHVIKVKKVQECVCQICSRVDVGHLLLSYRNIKFML